MAEIQPEIYNCDHGSEPAEPESASRNRDPGANMIFSHNPTMNLVDGSGNTIITTNYIMNSITTADRNAIPAKEQHEHLSMHIQLDASLPPRPLTVHGREDFVDGLVRLVTQSTTERLAVLGAGGMGKTTVILEVLYDVQVVELFGDGRLFLSCEALVDANAVVVKLAELCNIAPTTPNLQIAVVAYLTSRPRTVLVLDNLETVWLADGAPVVSVDDLLGRLAQIPSLWLMITCRGTILPQTVRWSNENSAALEPFSLGAALKTFADKAGYELSGPNRDLAEELLIAVDRMPLAVSLLGQLARRGNSLPELLSRWNREHSALLRTHGIGRDNNVEVSIKVSIVMLRGADTSEESLQLLSLCSMLPDGLRPEVFEKLRPQFKYIERARDTLSAYALVHIGVDRTINVLNPIRHLVLNHYPARSGKHAALRSIYFDIANRLPTRMDEDYKQLAAMAAPEMGNLSSLLLMLCHQRTELNVFRIEPSERRACSLKAVSILGSYTRLRRRREDKKRLRQIFDVVVRFAEFAYFQQPTTKLVSAFLLHLEAHPKWKARCLQLAGFNQERLGKYRDAIASFTEATHLFLSMGDHSAVAKCKHRAGDVYRLLGEYDNAEALLNEAKAMYRKLGNRSEEAYCRMELGLLMYQKERYSAAAEYFTTARQTFSSFGNSFDSAKCSEFLGMTNSMQDNFDCAATELRAARSAFITLGDQRHLAQTTRFLGNVERLQGNFALAEQLLNEAEILYKSFGGRLGLAECAYEFGCLRWDRERWEEAAVHFQSAIELYEALEMDGRVRECKSELQYVKTKLKI